ncbi:MAG: STAS domain-containing protein, partial [Sphingobacteriales bacterium]
VIIDFKDSRIADMSAIDALDKLTKRYKDAGKNLQLANLSDHSKKLLTDAGDVIAVNILETSV